MSEGDHCLDAGRLATTEAEADFVGITMEVLRKIARAVLNDAAKVCEQSVKWNPWRMGRVLHVRAVYWPGKGYLSTVGVEVEDGVGVDPLQYQALGIPTVELARVALIGALIGAAGLLEKVDGVKWECHRQ